MNAHLIWTAVGLALYPECKNWKALLARDLGVKPNTVIQWAKGHTIVSNPDIVRDVIDILVTRRNDIDYIIGLLDKMLDNEDAA